MAEAPSLLPLTVILKEEGEEQLHHIRSLQGGHHASHPHTREVFHSAPPATTGSVGQSDGSN